MRYLHRTDESTVFEQWFLAERYKMRVSAAEAPFVDSEGDPWRRSIARQIALWQNRYPLLAYLPPRIDWWRIELSQSDLPSLLLIFSSDWGHLCGGMGTVGEYVANGLPIPPTWQLPSPTDSIVLFGSPQGPFTILDGNHRIVRSEHRRDWRCDTLVYLGLSLSPCRWHRANAFPPTPAHHSG